MPIRGAYFQQSHEVMEPRRARNAINYTDCPRPLLGSGRNRYVRILPSGTAERSLFRIVRQKLLYVTYPKLSGPFVEFHKAIFGVGGWDPYSLPRFSNLLRSSYKQPRHAGKETGADASAVSLYAAVRSFVPMLVRPFGHGRNRDVSTGYAAQNNNPRLSDVANKSCLKGRPLKIWSCCPAPYGNGQPVCAASTGGRVSRPAPGAVSALDSSLSGVASLCSIGTALFC